jgi:hypothetical protein
MHTQADAESPARTTLLDLAAAFGDLGIPMGRKAPGSRITRMRTGCGRRKRRS